MHDDPNRTLKNQQLNSPHPESSLRFSPPPQPPPPQPRPYGGPSGAAPPSAARGGAPAVPRSRRRQKGRGCMPGPGCLLGCAGIGAAFVILLLLLLFLGNYQLNRRLDRTLDQLETNLNTSGTPGNSFETTFIYDRQGTKLWEVFGEGRRERVELDRVPQEVIWATISIEDDDFYNNPGFDLQSNLRAIGQYLREGRVVSGASTITQQLVRNVFFEPEYRAEQSVERKVEEILLAAALTRRMEKDEILELYLNEIYYGNLAYGIEAAARIYFGKGAYELELHEAAMLAGLPQTPGELDPLNPDPYIQARVINRQHLVLDLMVEEGYITEAEAESAKQAPLNYVSPDVPLEAPHFTLYAKRELESLLTSYGYAPDFIANGGLRVYTTIDLEMQQIAQEAAEDAIDDLRVSNNVTNAAVVVIHPPSGEILAMVGSVDYNDPSIDGQVNVAVSPRQPGSTMKPFTYAAALEKGWTPGTVLWDVRTNFGFDGTSDYIPVNYDRDYHGPMRMRDALANSYNIPAVYSLSYVGLDYLLHYMQRFGVQSLGTDSSRFGLSLTLGGGEVTLLEMTNAYATFARSGVYVPATSILCVVDKDDNIIYQYESRCPAGIGNSNSGTHDITVSGTPVIDPRIAFIISDILADNRARSWEMGSNSPLNTGDLISSVKTGTTDNFKDNWTLGYTHDLAVGVWSGNSDGTAMSGNISGLAGAAPIWNATVQGIYRTGVMPPSQLVPPPGLVQARICNVRGMRDPAADCPEYIEWFLDGQAMIPDGQGGLMPSGIQQPPAPPQSEFGPRMVEVEPDIWQALVRPVDANQANILMAQNRNVRVSPLYCLVPVEALSMVLDAREQLFIEAPPEGPQQAAAYEYAQRNNLPILPAAPCTIDTLTGFAQVVPGVSAQIVSPTPGQTVSGAVEIYGVVDYPDGYRYEFYKLEVKGGPWPDWTTLGDVHYNEVPQVGLLETFLAAGAPSGYYELRLFVHGELPIEPYIVPINLVN